MLDLAFKNITRQRTRTILTVLGILIGIGAIVALGSIAEGIDIMITKNLELTAGKIMVTEKGSNAFMGGGDSVITEEQLESLWGVPGVKDITPMILYFEDFQIGQGPQWWAVGLEPEKGEYFVGENIGVDGRAIEEGESGVAEIGKDLAERYNLEQGDFFTIKDTDFEIVGVLERQDMSDIDGAVMVPLGDLQDVLEIDTYQTVYVIPEDIEDTEIIAEEIEDTDDTLDAMTSKEIARQASEIVNQIRFFTFGIGAIAAVVGGLGVMNTMIMAIIERRREIGVMKAIGATNWMVLKQILIESAMMSLIGGIGGIMVGLGASFALGGFTGGAITPAVTPGLAATGLLFALFLGLAGGFYPAWRAAKLDPVEALRYE